MQFREKPNIIKTNEEIPSQEFLILPSQSIKKRIPKFLISLIKLSISVLICYFIFDKLLYKGELIRTYHLTIQAFGIFQNWVWISLLLIFLPLNWGLEAKKWHILSKKIEPVSFSKSFKAVLTGISFNMLAPFGLGDVFGRTYFLESNRKFEAVGSLIINRVSQLLPTLIFGIASIIFILYNFDQSISALLYLSFFTLASFLLFLIFKNQVYGFFQRKLHHSLSSIFHSLKGVNSSELVQVIAYSFLRYAVFTLQFLFVFYIFKIDLPIHILLVGIFWIFLVKTIAPSLSIFTDLATRELSALFYFSLWGVGHAEITAATMLIWIVNITIPAVVGILFIPNLKFLKSEFSSS